MKTAMKPMAVMKQVAAAAALALACAPSAAWAQTVAVTSIVEHPALDAVRDGVKKALTDAGYTEANGLRWQYQSAQGNTATAAQIARQFVGNSPDVIVAIATPSAQAVVAATKTIATVYAAVTDPVAAQLVPTLAASNTNVTGVSDALPLAQQVELIQRIVPQARRVGMVYSPGEANSVVVVEQMRALLPEYGMTLVEAAAARTVDVGAAARSLVGKVDVMYTSTDNNVVSAYEAMVKVGVDAKLPLIAADSDSVKRGAIASLGVNYFDMGVQAGQQVVRILRGEKPGQMASETSARLELYVNPKAASAQGVTLSEALIRSAAYVVE